MHSTNNFCALQYIFRKCHQTIAGIFSKNGRLWPFEDAMRRVKIRRCGQRGPRASRLLAFLPGQQGTTAATHPHVANPESRQTSRPIFPAPG